MSRVGHFCLLICRFGGSFLHAAQHTQPGKPQQNSYVERYNRTVRYDWLNQYLFESLEEIQNFATKWLWSYNNERPNMGIGGITPAMKLVQVA